MTFNRDSRWWGRQYRPALLTGRIPVAHLHFAVDDQLYRIPQARNHARFVWGDKRSALLTRPETLQIKVRIQQRKVSIK